MQLSEPRKTIMVIDDMAAILEHAKQLLKDEYSVIPCISAKQALEIMDKRKPDLILVDINMPEMDGFDFIRRIKSDERFSDVHVMMITAEITSQIESKGYELGAENFVLKPFSQPVMIRKITESFKRI
ncbi:MAG: response regulator [Lachnospiraceae bacterium]|nr:response regulator [Lachnospiraceae bacterium]